MLYPAVEPFPRAKEASSGKGSRRINIVMLGRFFRCAGGMGVVSGCLLHSLTNFYKNTTIVE